MIRPVLEQYVDHLADVIQMVVDNLLSEAILEPWSDVIGIVYQESMGRSWIDGSNTLLEGGVQMKSRD